MRKTVLLLSLTLLVSSAARAQVVPPAPGVDLPSSVIESTREKGDGAFQFQNAWIEKTRKIREARERYIEERGFYQREMLAPEQRQQMSVTGNFYVPVFCVKYSNTGADPYPIATMQTRLYSGPHAPQTLTQYYSEISYGDLNLTGTVYGWTALPNTDLYYAGAGTCNGLCGTSKVGELITTTLTANDGAVNFGQYDNDGPDGLPNSGDDDGFVDFVAFVHPEQGAECGVNGNIWSHRWVLSGWTGTPFVTNDARTGGGSILVNDYVIQPAFNCGGATVIDVGVFCHEYGHAFGLPDLYDTNGGSQGVGHWCLMGSGNWNTPAQPAHMSAWSKDQLGWANVVSVPAVPTPTSVYDVENHREVYRLDVTQERWRRLTDCAIAGSYSLRCGLLAAEATARNWGGGSGYGNNWNTTVSRDFYFDGLGPVTLSYQYAYDLEPGYDYAYGEVTSGGTTSTFATYNGVGSGPANINLTPYLTPGPYRVTFRVYSDVAYSDEDNSYPTACGALRLDNLSVMGGGEAYTTDFEQREDGWAEDRDTPAEYFLVENRQPLGSDANIWGGGGLAIWHIDQADQTGGPSNNRPRGVALMQADGLKNLETGANRGDAGDAYPGSTINMAFNSVTNPNSKSYTGPNSHVSVALTTGNGNPIGATMQGGWPAPAPASVAPAAGTSGTTLQVVINGAGLAKTGSAELVLGGTTIASFAEVWQGKDRMLASFDLTGAPNGFYDLVLYNPGGASAALPAVFEVTGAPTGVGDAPREFALRANYPNPFNPATTIRYDLAARSRVELRVYDVRGALVRTLVDEDRAAGGYSIEWDGRDDRGVSVSSGVYFYKLTAGSFSDVRKMTLVK